MKRQILISLILLGSVLTIKAQTWSGSTPGDIYYNQGKMGLGLSSPSSLLHIFQNSDIDPMATFTIQGTAASGSLPGISNNIGRILFTTRNNNIVGSIRGYYSGAIGAPNHYPFGNLIFYVGKGDNIENEAMRINQEGNVGINSSTPLAKLDIRGGAPSTTTDILHVGGGNSWGGNGAAITLGGGSLKSARLMAYTYDGNDHRGSLYMQTKKADGNWFNGLVIVHTTGYVGVGTDNPGYQLDVIGTIRAREIKVDLNGADFVFEKDYKLMPLNELEKFVKEQKHLPEIAPAKEMEANGTELGNLNSKLLQKMEEMTLYMIEQNKKLEQQNQELKVLKEEIEKLKAASK